ncbi:MAG: hypothetical protein ACR2GC_01550 [Methyloceanibacter sp.]|uniref:hypothetical protein n=1 Tax=Methyloceanibacter sp. TaxID=1965321 RepID=UPI003D9ABA43
MTDKTKAEHSFQYENMKEAIDRMKPELVAASDAAHAYKAGDKDKSDPDYERFDSTVELGYLVEGACGLCAPHLMLLNNIADALAALEAGEEEKVSSLHRH